MSNPNPDSHDPIQILQDPNNIPDPQIPLHNLSLVRTRIDSLRNFLSQSIYTNTPISNDQITEISNQIASSIDQTIVNAAAIVSYSQNLTVTVAGTSFPPNNQALNSKIEPAEDDEDVIAEGNDGGDYEIMEIDAVELLAEHIHFCEICGKGFRRDANLRMHMRAHGNKFKTLEALSKPSENVTGTSTNHRETRFSCPFKGCTRNKIHKKFRSLKSVICVKNHFKRTHCPKMYACNRCNKKNFSVVSDLKSHMRNCGGESKWKCCCGTRFSRKDKLFGHIALFEGHMPALEEEEKGKRVVVVEESEDSKVVMESELVDNSLLNDGLPELFFDDFGSIDDYSFMLDE